MLILEAYRVPSELCCIISRVSTATDNHWAWAPFLQTAVATFLGALLSFVIALAALNLQQIADRRRRFDEVLAGMLTAMRKLADDCRESNNGTVLSPPSMQEFRSAYYIAMMAGEPDESSVIEPFEDAVFWALRNAMVIAPGLIEEWTTWLQAWRVSKRSWISRTRESQESANEAIRKSLSLDQWVDMQDVLRKRYL